MEVYTSGNVSDRGSELRIQEILFTPNKNDLQEKKVQLQCNKFNSNIYTWKPFSFSE